MNQAEILEIFKNTGALLSGHFELSSGLHTSQYLQCALVLQNPEYAEGLCGKLALSFKDDNINLVIGPALGGIIVSYETARMLGARSIFAERKNGRMLLRRGFGVKKTDRVLVVEDVVTTGASIKEVIDIISEKGAHLAGIGALVDRSENADFKKKLKSLIKIDIPTFEPDNCQLCKDRIPLVKPGSKNKIFSP